MEIRAAGADDRQADGHEDGITSFSPFFFLMDQKSYFWPLNVFMYFIFFCMANTDYCLKHFSRQLTAACSSRWWDNTKLAQGSRCDNVMWGLSEFSINLSGFVKAGVWESFGQLRRSVLKNPVPIWRCMHRASSHNMYIHVSQQDAQNYVIRFYFPLNALHVSDCISPSSGATL